MAYEEILFIWFMNIYLFIVHSVLGYAMVQLLPTAFTSLSELQTLISLHNILF